ERLSGDQNGSSASSVPGSGCAAKEFSGRTYSSVFSLASVAQKASCRPSGESAKIVPTPKLPFSGGSTVKRIACADGCARLNQPTPSPAEITNKIAAAIQPS